MARVDIVVDEIQGMLSFSGSPSRLLHAAVRLRPLFDLLVAPPDRASDGPQTSGALSPTRTHLETRTVTSEPPRATQETRT
jgi:hypothetical protein